MALGNHEFDYGPRALAGLLAESSFPILCANLDLSAEPALVPHVVPWVVKVVSGVPVGIFGLITEETPAISSPGEGVRFLPALEAADRAVRELRKRGARVVIALTHHGFHADRRLAGVVPNISVIVGGHSHTLLGPQPDCDGTYPCVEEGPNGVPVLVVQSGDMGKYLGDLQVTFDAHWVPSSWGGDAVPLEGGISEDEAMVGLVARETAGRVRMARTVVGSAAVSLEANGVRRGESALGNLVADAMLGSMRPGGAQIALMHAGNIRASIPVGPVTLGQVVDMLPYGNTLALVELTGEQLLSALESGVSRGEAARFPHVAGLRFAWDPSAPPDRRLVSVEVAHDRGFCPLNLGATYRVVTNNILLRGGDGYTVMQEGRHPRQTAISIVDAVADYLRRRSPVAPGIEGRIVRQRSPQAQHVLAPSDTECGSANGPRSGPSLRGLLRANMATLTWPATRGSAPAYLRKMTRRVQGQGSHQ